MKKVITYGTFDLLHHGHIELLRRAKALGDHLTVALSTDEFNRSEKHKICAVSYEQRKKQLEETGLVDDVIPESSWEQKELDIASLGINVFVIGDDWSGKFDFLRGMCEVVYLPRTPGISSTELKKKLKGEDTDK